MNRFPTTHQGFELGQTVRLIAADSPWLTDLVGQTFSIDEIDAFFGSDEATIFIKDAAGQRHELYLSLGDVIVPA